MTRAPHAPCPGERRFLGSPSPEEPAIFVNVPSRPRRMQTFLPFADFDETAAVLDPRRLGKQTIEVLQILRALTRERYGWKAHPAVRMWAGYEEALGAYGLAVCRAWCGRGHADTCEAKIRDELAGLGIRRPRRQGALARHGQLPPWLGDEALHRSHRAALLRKDPEWYGFRFSDAPDDDDYVWPVVGS
ncbi:MAG TPA: MSMEG_6728 family protein [Acidimicrobiales bacterium]|nr:MSMEG_6728 family protein [Acidimicrobiales bacterium]